jgi:DNA-binding CsgD family transcriptional regulator
MNALAFAAPALLDLAEVAVEAGESSLAAAAATQLGHIAGIVERDLYRAFALLGESWAAIGRGRPDDAGPVAAEAAALLPAPVAGSASAYGPLRGRALMAQARARALEAGRPTAGLGELSAAIAAFEAAGTLWRRDRAVQQLRGLGRAGRRAIDVAGGHERITVRELEVARLAAERLTAREIAARLFISRRTVEAHLDSIYRKLDVSSKGELASRLSEITS